MGKLKISHSKFRQYLLDKYIDENGQKISDRVVWNNNDFFEFTGLYKINKYTGSKEMCSLGTVSFYKTKLKVKEEDVFRYHQSVTKRIPEDIEFEYWSKIYNRGHEKIDVLTDETVKRRFIKYLGFPSYYYNFTFEEVKRVAFSHFLELGLDSNEEMRKFYGSLEVVKDE